MNSLVPFCLAAFAVSSLPAPAQILADVARAELDIGWREADGSHVAGLTVRLAPGWKTYWRAPGEAGIPPMFDWTGSDNVSGVSVQFPVPAVFDVNGMRSIGYHDAVTFPLRIRTLDAAAPVRLEGRIEIGVCEEICVPVTLRIAADLPVKTDVSPRLNAALKDHPADGGTLECEIKPIADGLRVTASVSLPRQGQEEVAVVEAGVPGVWVSEADVKRSGEALSATVDMVPPNGKPFALARSDIRMTVLAGGGAVEMTGCE